MPDLGWTTLPRLELPFVGRSAALEHVSHGFAQASQGQGRVLLIAGEAGIGKSRLLQECATSQRNRALVLAGAGQPGEHELPYHPIVQALQRGLALASTRLPVEPIWLAEASLVLPELRSLYPDLPAPLQTNHTEARTRLHEALCRIALALASQGRPLLLCLDDLHWTDSASLALQL